MFNRKNTQFLGSKRILKYAFCAPLREKKETEGNEKELI